MNVYSRLHHPFVYSYYHPSEISPQAEDCASTYLGLLSLTFVFPMGLTFS